MGQTFSGWDAHRPINYELSKWLGSAIFPAGPNELVGLRMRHISFTGFKARASTDSGGLIQFALNFRPEPRSWVKACSS